MADHEEEIETSESSDDTEEEGEQRTYKTGVLHIFLLFKLNCFSVFSSNFRYIVGGRNLHHVQFVRR